MSPGTLIIHSACDECRMTSQCGSCLASESANNITKGSRKLKCSGDAAGCTRCIEKGITCTYSPQKAMGRPPKRRKDGPDDQTAYVEPSGASETRLYEALFQEQGLGGVAAPTLSPAMPQIGFENFGFSTDSTNNQTTHDSGQMNMNANDEDVRIPVGLGSTTLTPRPTPCLCLPNMYLSLSNLQAAEDISFPFALRPIRSAMGTAKAMVECEHCPLAAISAQQNTLFLVTLLTTIALQVDQLLQSIDKEAQTAVSHGDKKALILGDPSPQNMHLHTGTPDCPGKFTVELAPQEWAKITKSVVKKEVIGLDEGVLTLEKLVTELEQRQRSWHSSPCPHDSVLRRKGAAEKLDATTSDSNYNCLRMTKQVRHMMERLPWQISTAESG